MTWPLYFYLHIYVQNSKSCNKEMNGESLSCVLQLRNTSVLLLIYGTFVLGVEGNQIGSIRATWSMFRVLLKSKICSCTEPQFSYRLFDGKLFSLSGRILHFVSPVIGIMHLIVQYLSTSLFCVHCFAIISVVCDYFFHCNNVENVNVACSTWCRTKT